MNNSDSFNLYKYYDENVLKDNCEAMQDIFVKCKDVNNGVQCINHWKAPTASTSYFQRFNNNA